jgi:hypothetical protein
LRAALELLGPRTMPESAPRVLVRDADPALQASVSALLAADGFEVVSSLPADLLIVSSHTDLDALAGTLASERPRVIALAPAGDFVGYLEAYRNGVDAMITVPVHAPTLVAWARRLAPRGSVTH